MCHKAPSRWLCAQSWSPKWQSMDRCLVIGWMSLSWKVLHRATSSVSRLSYSTHSGTTWLASMAWPSHIALREAPVVSSFVAQWAWSQNVVFIHLMMFFSVCFFMMHPKEWLIDSAALWWVVHRAHGTLSNAGMATLDFWLRQATWQNANAECGICPWASSSW